MVIIPRSKRRKERLLDYHKKRILELGNTILVLNMGLKIRAQDRLYPRPEFLGPGPRWVKLPFSLL